jgi:hypothetical protein
MLISLRGSKIAVRLLTYVIESFAIYLYTSGQNLSPTTFAASHDIYVRKMENLSNVAKLIQVNHVFIIYTYGGHVFLVQSI